jgi:hypothetical protein
MRHPRVEGGRRGKRDGFVVVDVDGRWSHFVVVVAKPLADQSGRVAGISIGFSLFTRFA